MENVEYARKCGILPKFGWSAKFNHEEGVSAPEKAPGLRAVIEFASMGLRYLSKIYIPNKRDNTMPIMDPFHPVKMKPIYGVPLGGIGCGTIGRGFKGEFCRSSLTPGVYCHEIQAVDQFIATIKLGDRVEQRVLSPHKAPLERKLGMDEWQWGFPEDKGHYIALYPRSWTAYDFSGLKILLVCEQISPIIPNDYKDSCLPVGVFRWLVFNFNTKDTADVSITMTWRGPRLSERPPPRDAGTAGKLCREVGSQLGPQDEQSLPIMDEKLELKGCLLETLIGGDMPCCYGIAAKKSDKVIVTRCLGFQLDASFAKIPPSSTSTSNGNTARSLSSAPSASQLWADLKSSGQLSDDSQGVYMTGTPKRRSKLGVAVCAKCSVPPALPSADGTSQPGQQSVEFFLVWHMPRIHFRSAIVAYTRRYVRWFSEKSTQGAAELLSHAAVNWQSWRQQIEDWQRPILANSQFPDWYKSALFNELYFVSDGGTVWLDPVSTSAFGQRVEADRLKPPIDRVRALNPKVNLDPLKLTGRHGKDNVNTSGDNPQLEDIYLNRVTHGNEMGLFAYLEGHEYRMYNTYDVHFNASWALMRLWPKLQLAINYDLADMTVSEDPSSVFFIYDGKSDMRSKRLSVPHDCGDPEREPWYHVNAYPMYPTDNWKDLNSKFILMTWRDWKLTGDKNYLQYMMPIIVSVLKKSLDDWDSDGDGIIESGGFPDQTFDTWKTTGLGAYVGCLWIAALYAVNEMLIASSTLPVAPTMGNASDWSETDDSVKGLLEKAKQAYHAKLFNGKFYNYDAKTKLSNSSILADQLSGHWYLRLGGAPPNAILPSYAVSETLNTIMKLNWRGIKDGKLGAINGVLHDGREDVSNIQAEEFWVAVNYGLGSLLILEGKEKEGFELAGACFNHVYDKIGLHFQTPEAFTKDARFRSLGYMRPLAIWSIQCAIELLKSMENNN